MDNIKKTELNHLQADLADEMSHYAQFKALLVLAFIVTLISYLLFSGHLKLGNPLYWGEYFNKGAVTMAAFVFMLVSVILLGVFLAWVKHFAYNHFTTYRAIAGVMITLVGFALLAEMFAALEDQKAKADIQLEGNSAYQATIAPTGSGISASPTLAADIAEASQKLARCKANLGKPGYKHCDGDKAKLDALEKQQAAALNAQVVASTETQKLRYERQDQMKADAHNDFIVGLAQFYAALFGDGTEKAYVAFISWGNITLMLIIAIAFERLHAFLIEAGRNIKANIRGLEQSIAQLQESTSPLANNKHLPPVGTPLFKHQQEGNHTPTPFNPAPAMAKNDGAYSGNRIGFNANLDTENRRKYPQEILYPTGGKTADDYALMPRKERIHAPTPTTVPAKTEQPEQTVYTVLEQSPEQPEQAALEQHDDLYPTWRSSVKNKHLTVTARGCQNLIEQHKGARVSMREAAHIWNTWGNRGIGEGYLKLNPDYTSTNRKLKYILA